MHKAGNVLDKVPKSVQPAMKTDLREIHAAPTRAAAEAAVDVFVEKYGAKYARAAECLTKDRVALLALYDFPAEHWDHLRTTDVMDKRLEVGSVLFSGCTGDLVAKSGVRLQALPGCLHVLPV